MKNAEEKFVFIEKFSVENELNPNIIILGNSIQSHNHILYHNYTFHLIIFALFKSEIVDEAHKIYNKVIHSGSFKGEGYRRLIKRGYNVSRSNSE